MNYGPKILYNILPRDQIDLIMMLHSAARNFEVRMDSRNTWKMFEQRFVWNQVRKSRLKVDGSVL